MSNPDRRGYISIPPTGAAARSEVEPSPMPQDPRLIYLAGYRKRVAEADAAAAAAPTDANLAARAERRQEVHTVDRILRRFVAGMRLTDPNSGLVHWTKSRPPRSGPDGRDVLARLARPDRAQDPDLARAAMILAANRATDGDAPAFGACRVRGTILRGEAALGQGDDAQAAREYDAAARAAAHVTLTHRRLGQIARRRGDHHAAAFHFEAACATPNMSWLHADKPDSDPIRMGTIPGWVDFICYRQRIYAVPAARPYAGVIGAGGRLLYVPDTRAYRLWKTRVGPALEAVSGRARHPNTGLGRTVLSPVRWLNAEAVRLRRMARARYVGSRVGRALRSFRQRLVIEKAAASRWGGLLSRVLRKLTRRRPGRQTMAARQELGRSRLGRALRAVAGIRLGRVVRRRIAPAVPLVRERFDALRNAPRLLALRLLFRVRPLGEDRSAPTLDMLLRRLAANGSRTLPGTRRPRHQG